MKADINGELYEPIIIVDLPPAFAQTVIVSDGNTIRKNDILVGHFHTKVLVCNSELVEDLFEDFWLLEVQPLNQVSTYHVQDFLEIGEELKILASAIPEG